MRILVVQETDWVERNPILHHRMLESLSLQGDEIIVIDYDIRWRSRGSRPFVRQRAEIRDCHKFFPGAAVTVVRPGMLRVPGLGRLSWIAANVGELRRVFRDFQPEVVVGYSVSNAYLAQRRARGRGIPFVYHLLDALHTLAEPAALRPLARPIERAVLRAADETIVINQALRDYAIAMGADPAKVHLIPMGSQPGARVGHREGTRRKLGFTQEDTVLLFMGWLYKFSGLVEVVEELHRQRHAFPWLKLLVVGDGDLEARLATMRIQLGIQAQLVLTGRRPPHEMPDYLAAADFGLLPARPIVTMRHIVPAKVIEYMEAGKPVVATRLPGLQAEFGQLEGLLYVDKPGDALGRVVEAVGGAKDRAAAAAALGESCREAMMQREDWPTVTVRFAEVVHGSAARAKALSR